MSQQDELRRFMFEGLGVRGLWVRLTESWQSARQHQHAPEAIQNLLGQALAATTLLSATIKFKGSLILQAQGNGAVRALVAQATHDRKIRGLIKTEGTPEPGSLQTLFGEGRLVITISTDNAKPYQGVVPLVGDNLAAALVSYFSQSEQIGTRLWLVADHDRATGLLLQELPSQSPDAEGWRRIGFLADTVTEHELQGLDCETLLFRLFHEENLRLYQGEPVTFDCSCSRTKIQEALRLVGQAELSEILDERGEIEVNCEFCNQKYGFDRIDIGQLFLSSLAQTEISMSKH